MNLIKKIIMIIQNFIDNLIMKCHKFMIIKTILNIIKIAKISFLMSLKKYIMLKKIKKKMQELIIKKMKMNSNKNFQ